MEDYNKNMASQPTKTLSGMTGFTIVKAESHEAAAKLFEGHPHFTIFPGDAVEVMEIMPVPGVPR